MYFIFPQWKIYSGGPPVSQHPFWRFFGATRRHISSLLEDIYAQYRDFQQTEGGEGRTLGDEVIRGHFS